MMIYDELSFFDEERKKEFEEEYGEEYNASIEAEIEFDELFNNKDSGELYIVTGTIGLWDRKIEDFTYPNICSSIKSAILIANSDFSGHITVEEGKYGRLLLNIYHHDSSNYLEIRELTELGRDLWNRYVPANDIAHRKGATRNVKFTKRYMGR